MQVTTSPIANDRELVACLGLTEEQLSAFLGRTRGALTDALDGDKPYLSAYEVAQLRVFTQQRGKTDCDDAAILDYLERRHEWRSVKLVRKSLLHIAASVDLGRYAEIWVVLPDFTRLVERNQAGFIKEAAQLNCDLAFFFGSPIAQESLHAFLGSPGLAGRNPPAHLRSDSLISSETTRVFGNPRSKDVKTYVTGNGGLIGETASERRMQDWARRIFERTRD